jgi:hypothetical protein
LTRRIMTFNVSATATVTPIVTVLPSSSPYPPCPGLPPPEHGGVQHLVSWYALFTIHQQLNCGIEPYKMNVGIHPMWFHPRMVNSETWRYVPHANLHSSFFETICYI